MKKVLHLSHTDIKSDSRILKEIHALSESNQYHISSIGIALNEGNQTSSLENYTAVNLISKKLRYLPKIFRHGFTLFEFMFKILILTRKQQIHIIHCHDTLVLPIGILLGFLKKTKIIYDAHELESDRNGLSKYLGKITYFIEKTLWYRVDAFITVSTSIKSWYLENFGNKISTVILNSPHLPIANTQQKPNYLRQYFNIKNNYPIFIYVGILTTGRGIDIINQAFLSGQIKSNLIYLGYGELYQSIEKITQQSNNIYIHPAVSHDEVVPVISTADYGLCLIENISLSDYYCLPNKLFEYAFADLKILASNFPELSKTIQDYNLGETCDLSPQALIKAIQKIELSSTLCPSSNSINLYPLSWEAQKEKLLKLYDTL